MIETTLECTSYQMSGVEFKISTIYLQNILEHCYKHLQSLKLHLSLSASE